MIPVFEDEISDNYRFRPSEIGSFASEMKPFAVGAVRQGWQAKSAHQSIFERIFSHFIGKKDFLY
jgi:hypothetical protein